MRRRQLKRNVSGLLEKTELPEYLAPRDLPVLRESRGNPGPLGNPEVPGLLSPGCPESLERLALPELRGVPPVSREPLENPDLLAPLALKENLAPLAPLYLNLVHKQIHRDGTLIQAAAVLTAAGLVGQAGYHSAQKYG